jgi:hypothetical protein
MLLLMELGTIQLYFFDALDAPFRRSLSSLVSDYRNQIINMDGFGSIQNPISHRLITDEY